MASGLAPAPFSGTLGPMKRTVSTTQAYVREVARATPAAIRGLRRELGVSRAAAAEVLAATAALVPAGLARLVRRSTGAGVAVETVKAKGRSTDLRAPEIGLAGRLEKPRLSARLGGLLGEGGPRAARWVAERTGASEEDMARAIAAAAPIALGALDVAVEPRLLENWVATMPDRALTSPEHLLDPNDVPAEIFRRLRRLGQPLLVRLLGLAG